MHIGRKPKAARGGPPLLIRVFGILAIVASLVGSFILSTFLPTPASHNEGGQHFPRDPALLCPDYGCPIYPLEKDDEQVQKALKYLGSSKPFARPSGTTVTYQSNDHLFNQDRAFIIRPFHTHQTLTPHKDDSFLLAILDGHGVEGHIVADYVSKELPRLLASKLNDRPCCQSDEWIQQQLVDTFVQVNQEAPENALRGGCTASVTLRIGSKLYIANAGDSRTLLVTISHDNNNNNEPADDHNVQIAYQTRPDKPHLPDERARIEGMGGTIHTPPSNPALSRVIVYSTAAHPPELIGLAMSRSIGDWEWKEIGVTAEPIVDVIDLTAHKQGVATFVLAASDGLWDLRKPQFLVKYFAKSFLDDSSNLLQTCTEAMDRFAPKIGYRDDITIIVAPLTRLTTNNKVATSE